MEERIALLEKRVAELERQLAEQPEKILNNLVQELKSISLGE